MLSSSSPSQSTTRGYESKSYEQIANDIIDHVTKRIVRESFLYDTTMVSFNLSSGPVRGINSVTGQLNGEEHIFEKDKDYRLAVRQSDESNQGKRYVLEWLADGDNTSNKPDDKSEVSVSYTLDDQPILTDSSTGSVLRTIVEAVSREIEYLYLQMDKVYEAGFIDTAKGNALDLVVSILGREYERLENEHDNTLRERAKRALAVSGKATLESIKGALKNELRSLRTDPRIIEPPDLPGIIQVVVDIFDDDPTKKDVEEVRANLSEKIMNVVNKTKAAGIWAELVMARTVKLNVKVTLSIRKNVVREDVESKIRSKVTEYFNKLGIGEEVRNNKLAIYLAEVQEIEDIIRVTMAIEGGQETTDNIQIDLDSRARPADIQVSIVNKSRGIGPTGTSSNINGLVPQQE